MFLRKTSTYVKLDYEKGSIHINRWPIGLRQVINRYYKNEPLFDEDQYTMLYELYKLFKSP